MSIENKIAELTEAVKANTAALEKLATAGVSAPTATAAAAPASTTGKGKAAAEKKDDGPKVTQDEMNAAAMKLRDKFGPEITRELVSEFGKAPKLAEVKPAQYKALFDACVAKFNELEAAATQTSGDDI